MVSFRYPVEEIRARCDLAEVVSAYVTLKRAGKRLVGLCPFHNEKTPSFYVNQETQRYKCFGCGEGGDVISFLMRIEGLTFPEVAEQLARKTGVELKRSNADVRSTGERDRILRVNNLAASYFRKNLASSGSALDYCRARGITDEAVERYKLGLAPDGWTGLANYLEGRVNMKDAISAGLVVSRESGGCYDVFRNRLMFPIQDVQDRIVGFGGRALGDEPAKYINSAETPLFSKSRTLYGLNIARKTIAREDRVILVEGYLDVLSAQMAGFENTVAAMGTALTRDHVILLARYTQNAVLAYDSDSAGTAAAARSAPMFEEVGVTVRVAEMPNGEDPDSLFSKGESAVFARAIDNAVPLSDYRLNRILEKHDLATPEGRRDALAEALPVVGEIENALERERLITVLAKYHRARSSGEALEEPQLRQEVERIRARKKQGFKPVETRAEAPGMHKDRQLSAVEKAERTLLGIIIRKGQACEQVFAALSPDQFISVEAGKLAATVQELWATTGNIHMEELSKSVAGCEAEKLLNEIMVGAAPWESDDVPVEDLIEAVILHRKKMRRKRFKDLAERLERGELNRNDEEFAEYWALVRELHG